MDVFKSSRYFERVPMRFKIISLLEIYKKKTSHMGRISIWDFNRKCFYTTLPCTYR